MYIAEIVFPGAFLEWKEPSDKWMIENILRDMMSQLRAANVAVLLFEDAKAIQQEVEINRTVGRQDIMTDPTLWHLTIEERAQIEMQKEAEKKRALWDQGNLPEDYLRLLPFMNARAFVIAMHLFSNFLSQLAKIEGIPLAIHDVKNRFKKEFPLLTDVRDSDQHMDERVRGMARREPIRIKTSDAKHLGLPDGAMLVGVLRGNMYAATTRYGDAGHIAVSEVSLRIAQECLQACIDAFTWTGIPMHYPR